MWLSSIRKTPHLLFHLFQCFSMLFSEKAEKAKKAIPSTFFVLVKVLRKSTRKADYQMDKNGQKKCPKMDKNGPNRPKWTKLGPKPPQIEQTRTKRTKKGPNIQCSPRKMSKKAQKAQEKYMGIASHK